MTHMTKPKTFPPLSNLSFSNTQVAFAHVSDEDLQQAYWLFKALANPLLVKIGPSMAAFSLKLGLPVKPLIKATVFNQFCGGETIDECKGRIQALAKGGVGTILDYSVEGRKTEADLELTSDEIARTIELAAVDRAIPFAVFKVTGVARFGLLEKSDRKVALTSEEKAELGRAKARVERLCRLAHDKGVRLLIDAEESWIQETIDSFAFEMMRRYNVKEAIVYNTFQMYRHDRLALLESWYGLAKSEGFHLGIKLVRGAYMEKENERAAKLGLRSPIHSSKAATDRDYDAALRFATQHWERIALCAGTHNEASTRLLAELVEKKGIERDSRQIEFAQLLGMSDNLTYNLAYFGFNASKYVPYGPVREVLPYLSRRAQENTSIQGQTSRELSLIQEELERRKRLCRLASPMAMGRNEP